MRVALLTLPLIYNYGGILQAYALQKKINDLGAECTLMDVDLPVYPYYRRPLTVLNRCLLRLLKKSKCEIIPYWMNKRTERIISQNTRKFVEEKIKNKTTLLSSPRKIKEEFDTYIVGSDQVWRRSISLKIEDYLFGFIKGDKRLCSYAASFGVDYWEFNNKKTRKIESLLSRFSMITVREDSAVKLLHEKIGINSIQVVDPTLLLSNEEYLSIVGKDRNQKCEKYIFEYILDSNSDKDSIRQLIENQLNLKADRILPREKPRNNSDAYNCIYRPVEDFITGISEAAFVVTDSFHGTVFSIIFNKPFVVLKNNSRGNTRLESLLRMFGLTDRLISGIDQINRIINHDINWDNVNFKLNEERDKGISLLKEMIYGTAIACE